MGSLIYLRLGRLELDWSKNSISTNHSVLFCRRCTHGLLLLCGRHRQGEACLLHRPLHTIVRRLDLLGFTVPDCERL